MYKTCSNDKCHCKIHKNSHIQLKLPAEKATDSKYKSVKTQTDFNHDFKAQEEIADLLTEIAIILDQKSHLEDELNNLRVNSTKLLDKQNEEKSKAAAEVLRLTEENIEKDSVMNKMQISHLEEQKQLLSQINELKTELYSIKEQKDQSEHDLTSSKLLLEQKLNFALTQLNCEQEKNHVLETKINKYKCKLKYLTKYVKHLIEEINNIKSRTEHADKLELKNRSSSIITKQKSLSTVNVLSRQTIDQQYQPDIESMVLSELFFKPNPVPNDIEDLFFCSLDQSYGSCRK